MLRNLTTSSVCRGLQKSDYGGGVDAGSGVSFGTIGCNFNETLVSESHAGMRNWSLKLVVATFSEWTI